MQQWKTKYPIVYVIYMFESGTGQRKNAETFQKIVLTTLKERLVTNVMFFHRSYVYLDETLKICIYYQISCGYRRLQS